jgi:HD-GYP domain-containing protein (c-di-GMP phosphodiesterase class II)
MVNIHYVPFAQKIFYAQDILNAFLFALKQKDIATYTHCLRVGHYCKEIAKHLTLNEVQQEMVYYSGMFHDIGKMGIPDNILLKPGRLNPEEYLKMQQHPVLGTDLLKPFQDDIFIASLLPGIKHHHERIDGQGYPDGLSKDQIPLTARIILIADTFDAMTSNRSYRQAAEPLTAIEEIKRFSGKQFDKELVDVFLKTYSNWEKFSHEQEITVQIKKVA